MLNKKTLGWVLREFNVLCGNSLNPAQNAGKRDEFVERLRMVQENLWTDYAWPHLVVDRYIEVQAGQRYYSPEYAVRADGSPGNDWAIDRIVGFGVRDNDTWFSLGATIGRWEYSWQDSDMGERSWPIRAWRIYEDEQIEIWPVPDKGFDATTREGWLRVSVVRDLKPFKDDSDRCDIDGLLIALYAAAEVVKGEEGGKLLGRAQRRQKKLQAGLAPRTSVRIGGNADAMSLGVRASEGRFHGAIQNYVRPTTKD